MEDAQSAELRGLLEPLATRHVAGDVALEVDTEDDGRRRWYQVRMSYPDGRRSQVRGLHRDQVLREAAAELAQVRAEAAAALQAEERERALTSLVRRIVREELAVQTKREK